MSQKQRQKNFKKLTNTVKFYRETENRVKGSGG